MLNNIFQVLKIILSVELGCSSPDQHLETKGTCWGQHLETKKVPGAKRKFPKPFLSVCPSLYMDQIGCCHLATQKHLLIMGEVWALLMCVVGWRWGLNAMGTRNHASGTADPFAAKVKKRQGFKSTKCWEHPARLCFISSVRAPSI